MSNAYDSDDSEYSDYESNVHLGIPDGGPIAASDHPVIEISRIGGQPCFPRLRSVPSTSSNQCKICNGSMQLLIQIFAPYPDSVNDRVLYFFACSRATCQKKEGSVRAYRCLSRNERWARKLERLKEKEKERKKRALEEENKAKEAAKSNPFTYQTQTSNAFTQSKQGAGAFGSFGGDSDDSDEEAEQPRFKKVIESDSEESEDSDEELEAELAKLELSDGATQQSWTVQPSFGSQYIATAPEVIPKESDKAIKIEDVNQTLQGGGASELEEFEKSMGAGMDEAFEHFVKRVSHEPQQCIRYDLGGSPLMYTNKDAVYKDLYGGGQYSLDKVPKCGLCGSSRVFECQVTPNIINLCSSDQDGSKDVQDALAGKGTGEMEWGTILLYVCENDCCLDAESKQSGQEARENWVEELAYVQWE
ncbi:hypothetical protein E3P99_02491 [Wallemia hederae]|uniref:Programmed cell death protein 2 C-terminal domain-containing protein n=1 Tax=Wallemia hederae TaxID=1540922 RepID=A0A4T0FK40_9BASI|nr:hypothetical protein E3P99_02491 [Wallemia hederae]